MFQYISPVDKAKKYLNNLSMQPEDENFISQATQNGYDENFYLPAIASKKMRQKDTELQSKYQSYKESPTTFMSQLKNQYGKEGRWVVGDTLWFFWNLFTDTGEAVEELGSAVLNPIDTVKWIAGIFSKEGMKAVKWAIIDNFGTMEKAKETFYENPFDVLSVVLPIAKIGTAGKLGKMAKATKVGSKIATAVEWSKHATLIKNLADLTNWDLNLIKYGTKWAMSGIGGGKNLASQAFSKLALWNADAAAKITERASTWTGRQALGKMMEMWEPQMVRKIDETIPKIEQAVGKETFTAATESKQLGSYPTPEWFVEWPISGRKLVNPTTETGDLFSETWVNTNFKLKQKPDGTYIELAEEGIEKTPEAIKAEQAINDVLKETNFTDFLKDFDPVKGSQVLKKLNARMAGTGEAGGLAADTANRVKQFSKWIRDAQTTAYPLIKRARKEAREVTDLMKDFKKEISMNAKDSTLINRVKGVLGNEITNKAVKYINQEGGLNLEDMAIALTAKQPISSIGRTSFNIVMGAGAGILAWSWAALPIALWALGAGVLTSPYVLVRILKNIGWPLKQWKKATSSLLGKLSSATKIPEADLMKAAQKIAENPKSADSYLNMMEEILKWLPTGAIKNSDFLEKINRNIQEQYMNESNELKWDISEMEQEVQKWVESKVQNMPTDYESQFTEPLPEWAYINPDYL
jgi:hypothetical protein